MPLKRDTDFDRIAQYKVDCKKCEVEIDATVSTIHYMKEYSQKEFNHWGIKHFRNESSVLVRLKCGGIFDLTIAWSEAEITDFIC